MLENIRIIYIWSGTPKGIRFESGTLLSMDDIINEQLQDDIHVWVILKGKSYRIILFHIFFKEDIEALGIDTKKKTVRPTTAKSTLIRPKSSMISKK